MILNLVFVIVCGMAEDGVALSSIITQYVSALLILIRMGRQEDSCTFRLRDLKNGWIGSRRNAFSVWVFRPDSRMLSLRSPTCSYRARSIPSIRSWSRGNAAAANADSVIYNVVAAFYTASATFYGAEFGRGQA